MPGSSGESEHHCRLLEEAEDFHPPQHLQLRQDQLCGDTDATNLSCAQGQDHFAHPALPANGAKIPKPSKAELEWRIGPGLLDDWLRNGWCMKTYNITCILLHRCENELFIYATLFRSIMIAFILFIVCFHWTALWCSVWHRPVLPVFFPLLVCHGPTK